MTKLLDKGFDAQAKSMVEFGYPSVSASMIKEHHDLWIQGKKGSGVIWMFSEGAFKKHPEIFGEPT